MCVPTTDPGIGTDKHRRFPISKIGGLHNARLSKSFAVTRLMCWDEAHVLGSRGVRVKCTSTAVWVNQIYSNSRARGYWAPGHVLHLARL